MKQILIALCAFMCVTAQSATIKWGGTGAVNYGDTKLKNGAATAYLVYLGESVTDWSSWSYSESFETSQLASKATTSLSSIGNGNTFAVTVGSALGGISNISSVLKDGASSFGIIFTTTQDGVDYYYQGDVFTYDTSSSNYSSTTDTFTSTTTVAPTATDKWTAVPEPSTAALALAGLALLLKRRKA